MARTSIDALSLNKAEGDSTTASRRSGAMAPQPTYYKPSYKTLNHVTWSTDVSGRVNFAQAIGDTGQKIFENQISLETDELVSGTYDRIHKELQKASLNWKADPEHADGRGYLEYISSEHARLAEDALSGLIDPAIAGRMRAMLMRSKSDWENGAFEEEQAIRTAHSLRSAQETIANLNFDVANNPATYESGLSALHDALEGYRKVAGNTAYEKVYDESVKNFTYSYGLGLVQKDPANFERLAKDKRLSVISPERLIHLQRMASEEMRSRESAFKKAELEAYAAKVRDSNITLFEMAKKMLNDGSDSVSNTTAESAQLSPEQLKQFRNAKKVSAKSDLENELKLQTALNAVLNKVPLSGILKNEDQLVMLNKLLPPDDNGDPSKSAQDMIKMAANCGINANDPDLKARIHSQILHSEDADILQNAINARDLSSSLNDVLLGEAPDDVKYVMQRCRGAPSELVVKIAQRARDRLDTINNNPAKKEAIASGMREYFASNEYQDLVDGAWEDVRKDLYAPDLFKDKDWKEKGDDWFGYTKPQKYQTEETMRDFYVYFKSRTDSLVRNGWQPADASQQIISEFKRDFGTTALVPFKVMAKPPEKVYPSLNEDALRSRFHKAFRTIIDSYNEKNVDYRPGGYKITYSDNGARIKYSNGNGNKSTFPNLEWNKRSKGYNLYIIKDDGTRLYFTKASSPWELVSVNLDEEELNEEKPNVSK